MSSLEESDNNFYECVKDLNPNLHAGGYPARAVVIETVPGRFVLYKTNISPDKAINLARTIAKNEPRTWYKIHCVNQKTKTRIDTISKVN